MRSCSELRGSLQVQMGTWLENLQKGIVNACKELKEQSDELFVPVYGSENAAFALSTDLRMKAIYLEGALDERQCEELGPDSREIGWLCHTLNQNCRRLRAEQLRRLNDAIHGTEEGSVYSACLAQNVTCKIITKSVKSKCAALDGHMKTEKVVEEEKRIMEKMKKQYVPIDAVLQ
ncbi:hypothetical protein PMAC_003404 [Pneumocystis sp. 'macacae']|nr:hypothetical protein PMAC_003404 [Pneumocystis sp. 'macacae']